MIVATEKIRFKTKCPYTFRAQRRKKLKKASKKCLRFLKEDEMKKNYDVVIIGAGVSGGGTAFALSAYSSIKNIVVIEKYPKPGQVNSHPLNNAQTRHNGSMETNYDIEHASYVHEAATMLTNYVDGKQNSSLSQKIQHMVMGVGEKEIKKLYPDVKFVEKHELAKIEPNVIKERNSKENICALVSSEGRVINYQKLAESFLKDAQSCNPNLEIFFNTSVISVKQVGDEFVVETDKGEITAKTVEFDAGPYSLLFAQKLGYGKKYGILPVAGSFYSSQNPTLNGKVYTVQESIPFAAVHGDPDIVTKKTRFGPTAKILPLLERHKYKTFFDFIKNPLMSLKGIVSLLSLTRNKTLTVFMLKNILFDIPILGKYLFLKRVRKIVPSMKYGDISLRKGTGGIRPQIINVETGELMAGEIVILVKKLIFNAPPSPGASVSLQSGYKNAKRHVEFLGKGHVFYEDRFQKDLL